MSSDTRDRHDDIADFLEAAGWAGATSHPLGEDASTRRYIRLIHPGLGRALLMDAPRVENDPCPPDADEALRVRMGWNAMSRLAASRVDAFVLIAAHLRSLGFHAPEVYAHDTARGFALIEDFGVDREFARQIEQGRLDELQAYTAAAGELARLHAAPVPDVLTQGPEAWPILDYDRLALAANADLYADWLPVEAGGDALTGPLRENWIAIRDGLIAQALNYPRSFTLRDYHAENLLWLPGGRVGMLDFQDAVKGWDAWDMAMLIQDARREVSPIAAETAVSTYLDVTGKSRSAYEERLAVLGALNALRVAGIFARLQHRDGKKRYGLFQPRQLQILARNLAHPALAEMRAFVREATPFVFDGAC